MPNDPLSSTPERHRPQKKWGQNFLRNPGAVKKIAAAVQPREGELIVEIGPGEGALTDALSKIGNRLLLVEIDPSLAARLRERFADQPLVSIVEGDATEVELPNESFVAVGNLPYNVGNRIIRRVIESESCRRAVFMVQKEVAERLTARPDSEPYGFLSIAVQLLAKTRQLFTLEPGSFFPPPKVRSTVVELQRAPVELEAPRELLLAVASAGFAMRRKKLRNNLIAAGLEKEKADEAMRAAGLGGDTRAEQMSLVEFDRLAAAIERGGDASLFLRRVTLRSE